MKPAPVTTVVNVVPEAAVGRLPGEIPLTVALAETTFTLIVTTIVATGLPQVSVTTPVNVCPGSAEANNNGSNVIGLGLEARAESLDSEGHARYWRATDGTRAAGRPCCFRGGEFRLPVAAAGTG